MPDRNTETHWDKRGRGKVGSPQEKSLIFHVGCHRGTHLFDGVWARKCSKNEKIRFLTFLPRPHLSRSHPLPRCPGVTPSPLSRSFSGSPQALIFGRGSAHSPVKGRYPFPFGSAAFSKHARHAMPAHDKTPARKAQGFLSHCHVMFRRRLTPRRKRCRSAHHRRAS